MARTVAHEGNPRTNSLAVSGTLDGDVFITIEGNSVPQPPTVPPTGPTSPPNVTSNSAVKYLFSVDPGFRFGVDGATIQGQNSAKVNTDTFVPSAGWYGEYSQLNGILMAGAIVSPTILTNVRYYDVIKSVASGTAVYSTQAYLDYLGMMSLDFDNILKDTEPPASYTSITLSGGADIKTAPINSPVSGAAVGVKPGSTFQNFTGIICTYDWATNQYTIKMLVDQDVNEQGTVIATENRVIDWGLDPLTAGDSLSIQMAYVISSNTFTITAGVGLSVTGYTASQLPYHGSDMRVAMTNHYPSAPTPGGADYVEFELVAGSIGRN